MRVRAVTSHAHFTPAQKVRLLALNALPLAHLAGLAALVTFLPPNPLARLVAGLGWFFILPPLLARIVLLRSLPQGEIAVPSAAFFRWWTTWQLQAVFNRLPWIEELLRFIPGAYSAWLRLWGARVGRLTLWSPGVRVFDRPLLRIGDDVVLGIDTRLVGHFGALDATGCTTFTIGLITLGDRCTLGASALLGPGVTLGADQTTEVLFLGTPFTQWREGARVSSTTQSS